MNEWLSEWVKQRQYNWMGSTRFVLVHVVVWVFMYRSSHSSYLQMQSVVFEWDDYNWHCVCVSLFIQQYCVMYETNFSADFNLISSLKPHQWNTCTCTRQQCDINHKAANCSRLNGINRWKISPEWIKICNGVKMWQWHRTKPADLTASYFILDFFGTNPAWIVIDDVLKVKLCKFRRANCGHRFQVSFYHQENVLNRLMLT